LKKSHKAKASPKVLLGYCCFFPVGHSNEFFWCKSNEALVWAAIEQGVYNPLPFVDYFNDDK
jgi:hypothetical protein